MTRYLHNFFKFDAFGGNTFALEIVDGRLFVGVAHCSERDQYDKKMGRAIAEYYLDELKNANKEFGYECVINEGDAIRLSKITGFVVNDELMYSLLVEESETLPAIVSHISLRVEGINYMSIEGGELKRMLVRYYNEIISSIYEDEEQDAPLLNLN